MAKDHSSVDQEYLSTQAFKSHFTISETPKSTKITDIIKGYALVETQKIERRGKRKKTFKQFFLPSLSEPAEEEETHISTVQQRIKRRLKEESPVTPKPQLFEVKTASKDWRSSLKRELKTIDVELQTLTARTHRAHKSMGALTSRQGLVVSPNKPKLPELVRRTPTLKYSLSTVSRLLPRHPI